MLETIRVMAAVFAAYEFYKMLNAGTYIRLIRETKELADQPADMSSFMANPFVQRVMLIEIFYIIFAVALIFTPYWYFTIVLFAVSLGVFSLVVSGRAQGSLIVSIGSAICALLLMRIVIL